MLFGVNIDELNKSFAIEGHISFQPGPGGLPMACVANTHAAAVISVYGAHVMSFEPHGSGPILWQSEQSYFEQGKPIRGGIPICWPWFGVHPTDKEKPSHGFARVSMWKLISTSPLGDGSTRIELELTENDETRSLWPHNFRVKAVVTVGEKLELALTTINTGFEKIEVTNALHSYFSVSNVKDISILGLEKCPYVDTLLPEGFNRFNQIGPIRIDSETDRVYLKTESGYVIDDPGMTRRIQIGKSGSKSAVVWNPWLDKSKRMPDFGDNEYPGMVCVEVVNTMDDAFSLMPGEEHTVSTTICSELY